MIMGWGAGVYARQWEYGTSKPESIDSMGKLGKHTCSSPACCRGPRCFLPYLRRIDASRWYSNHGPLVLEFEDRLTRHFNLPQGSLVSASTGTAGLVGAVLASAGAWRARNVRTRCCLPSHSWRQPWPSENCGYRPCLADVDPETWALDAERLLAPSRIWPELAWWCRLRHSGDPFPQAPWQAFRDKTGIPVVIDGAGSFEAISDAPGALPGRDFR